MFTNTTSGEYNFQNVQNVQIINEAFARIGIRPEKIPLEYASTEAIRSLNLILCQWINKSVNLWTLQQKMLALNPNQITYILPTATSDVVFMNLRNSTRQLNGTAFASSGVANNAFDNNPATSCTQTAPDGTIGYQWGSPYTIGMVGVQSQVDADYNLFLEYSNDGVTWTPASIGQLSTGGISYPAGQLVWNVIEAPQAATYFRVRESDGATLNIEELYFNTVQNDTVMTRMSYSEWMQINNKQNQASRPSQFFINRLTQPTVTIWPPPSAMYNSIFYVRIAMAEDIGTLQQTPAIPGRFYEPMVAALAVVLGMKFPDVCPLDKLAFLQTYANAVFLEAKIEDRERVPTRIFGDYSQGGNK